MPATLDMEARFTVDGYRGIAWYLLGYDTDWKQEEPEYLGEPEGYDPDTYYDETGYYSPDEDPANYIFHEPEEIENRGMVRAVMVGDDRVFTFDVEELTEIAELDYCAECGQIGCTGDFRDREEN